MKVYVHANAHLSISMQRVARMLAKFAPKWIEVVNDKKEAEFSVHHVIGVEALQIREENFAIIQYCLGGQEGIEQWQPLWNRARVTWSYYDLNGYVPKDRFYYAPLGVDPTVFTMTGKERRDATVLTSGYVTGRGAEAIEEVGHAAYKAGGRTIHLGPPNVDGMGKRPHAWSPAFGVLDADLVNLYRRCAYVSGLRYVEGFELPVLEGLACGCRPIVFDRPDMRRWYEGHAIFIPETSGRDLIDLLVPIFRQPPLPVSEEERNAVVARFDWKVLVEDFWSFVGEAAA